MVGSRKDVWVDFSPLRRIAEKNFPYPHGDFERNSYLIGPAGEKVPLEGTFQKENPYTWPFGFIRIGNLAFLNDTLKPEISDSLQDRFRDNTIWLSDFDAIFAKNRPHLQYAPLAIYGLSTLDLQGRHVWDLGAADGVMGLVALKRGASRVTLVDIENKYQAICQRHLRTNGFDKEKTQYVVGDMASADKILGQMQVRNADVAVANIGPTYGEGHMHAIALAAKASDLKTFIGGAYIKVISYMSKSHGLVKVTTPRDDTAEPLQLLKTYGFNSDVRELSYKTFCVAFMVNKSRIEAA